VYVTDLSAGDRILISLSSSTPAYPTGDSLIYKTGKKYKRNAITFTKGTAVVLSNSDKVLTFRFADFYNPSTSGIAAVEYYAISSIYLYEGETNAATVAEGLNDPTTAPAMDIYRKKVDLRWKG
jgi:hypothetical protein